MFNVGFLSSGVTRACLNAVGKMPVRREALFQFLEISQFFIVLIYINNADSQYFKTETFQVKKTRFQRIKEESLK